MKILKLKGHINNTQYVPDVGAIGFSVSISPPIKKEELEKWTSEDVIIILQKEQIS